jgi:hypothetical protein
MFMNIMDVKTILHWKNVLRIIMSHYFQIHMWQVKHFLQPLQQKGKY